VLAQQYHPTFCFIPQHATIITLYLTDLAWCSGCGSATLLLIISCWALQLVLRDLPETASACRCRLCMQFAFASVWAHEHTLMDSSCLRHHRLQFQITCRCIAITSEGCGPRTPKSGEPLIRISLTKGIGAFRQQ
jgi:hypothetical protein